MLEWNDLWYQYSFPSCSHDWGDAVETAKRVLSNCKLLMADEANHVRVERSTPSAADPFRQGDGWVWIRRWLSLDFTDATLLSRPCWALWLYVLRYLDGSLVSGARRTPKEFTGGWRASVSYPSTTLKGTGDSFDVPMRIAHATDMLKMYMESPKPAPTTGASIVSLNLSTRRNATRAARQTPLVRIARAWRCLCY